MCYKPVAGGLKLMWLTTTMSVLEFCIAGTSVENQRQMLSKQWSYSIMCYNLPHAKVGVGNNLL